MFGLVFLGWFFCSILADIGALIMNVIKLGTTFFHLFSNKSE